MNTLQIKCIQKFKPIKRWSKEVGLDIYQVRANIDQYKQRQDNRFELPSSNPYNGLEGEDKEYWWKSPYLETTDPKPVTTIDMTQDQISIVESKPSKRLGIFNRTK